ncbi:VIT and vWA domain-containing protein [Tropicimonas sp.]|uniref:VIT and vWA domain-containing protein n=1 Tax=Tropicimonas sp. TaxID=2067044 RepID=UPI003A88AD0F
MISLSFRTLLFACLVAGSSAAAQTGDRPVAGQIIGETAGARVALPLLRSDYRVEIDGDLADVTVTQVFANPHVVAMSAEYLFPLNRQAAIHAMKMTVGDEVIRETIRKKSESEETFETAEAEGKAAALLTQHRPNMFTQRVANLMPGVPVTVELSYVQPVPRIDGAYELVVPLLVGPRYQSAPEPAEDNFAVLHTDAAGWEMSALPDYPPVAGLDLPDEIAPERVGLDLRLTSAVPVLSLSSATHDLAISEDGNSQRAAFADGRVIDNRDLVVRYILGGDTVTAGALTHRDARGGFLSLLIEPPAAPEAVPSTPREVVFVLDTSGSMDGEPIAASKRFMAAALDGLREGDYFRILSFSDATSQFAGDALPATPANLRRGSRYVRALRAGGGTELDAALAAAFATRPPGDALRLVVFLTDGYIGDEASVLERIRRDIGQARIYAFGVGTSVNRYLLDGMADEGRGYARYVDPGKDAGEIAEQLAADLRTPLLTDIAIDWGDLKVTEVTPARIPDLFAGNQLRVLARYEGDSGALRVNGQVAGHRASLPVTVAPAGDDGGTGEAIALIWARGRIADHERALAVRAGNATAHEEAITRLGLDFGLQSRFTSFVAVSEQVMNPTGAAQQASVALPQGVGVPATAYPGFSGSSTPEPQAFLGLIVLGALTAVRLHRRRRAC